MTQPTLQTPRLILRPYEDADAEALAAHCNQIEVSRQTATFPHPFTLEEANSRIARWRRMWEAGEGVCFAIILRATGAYIGGSGLNINAENRRAEIGYTIDPPLWGNGYATEAVHAVLRYGFVEREPPLHRIHAAFFADNPASGRVLEKAGMMREGVQREHACRFGEFRDLVLVGMLREEYLNTRLA